MKTLIGITTYGRDQRGEFHLPGQYVDAVLRAGGTPMLIPHGPLDTEHLLARIDGLILAGGGDLDPDSFGGNTHETLYMTDAQRDRNELALARRVVADGFPTLAICRGLQVVNVALGGTLIEHVPEQVGEDVAHRLPPREPTPHRVTVAPDSRLAKILGCTQCTAFSWHHQATGQLGTGLSAVAHAPDGIIEAVETESSPQLVAVQWHPELSADEDPLQQRFFDNLVHTASDRRTSK